MQDVLREAIRWLTRTQYSAVFDTQPEEVAFASTALDYLYLHKWDGSAMELVAVCYKFYVEQTKISGASDAATKAAEMLRHNVVEMALLNTTSTGTSTVQTESTITRVVKSQASVSTRLAQ